MVVAEKVERREWYKQLYNQEYNIPGNRNKKHSHKKGRMLLALGIIAVISILILFRYSIITESQYRISKLSNELADLNAQNERLRVEAASLSSVARIEDIATNKLNMKTPESHQIIYLNKN